MDTSAAIPDWLEAAAAWALFFSILFGALAVIWKFGPISWFREQIADEAAGRIVARLEEPLAKKVTAANTEILEMVKKTHEVAIGAEQAIEAHIADSKRQHADDLEMREKRQGEIDEERGDHRVRIAHLEGGHTELLARVGTVEKLAMVVARKVGAGDEADRIVAIDDAADDGS